MVWDFKKYTAKMYKINYQFLANNNYLYSTEYVYDRLLKKKIMKKLWAV